MKLEKIKIIREPRFDTGTKKDGNLWHRLSMMCKEERYAHSEPFYVVAWGELAEQYRGLKEGDIVTTEGPPFEVKAVNGKTYVNARAETLLVVSSRNELDDIEL